MDRTEQLTQIHTYTHTHTHTRCANGILVSQPGVEPVPPALESGALTSRVREVPVENASKGSDQFRNNVTFLI